MEKEMFINIGFPICSLIVSSIIIYLYISENKRIKNLPFLFSILDVIISTLFEITMPFLIKYNINTIRNIICKLYPFILTTFGACSVTYMLKEEFFSQNRKKLIRTIYAYEIITFIITLMLKTKYIINQDGIYTITGPAINVTYMLGLMFSLVIIYIFNTKNENIKNKIKKINSKSISFIMIINSLLIILKILLNINTTFVSCVYSLVILIIYLGTENKDTSSIDDLIRLQKEAEKTNLARTEYITNMSNTIKTPMSNIVGYCNLILLDNKNNYKLNIKNDAQNAYKESQNLLEIVNNVLDLARFEAKKETVQEQNYKEEDIILELNNLINKKDNIKSVKFNISNTIPTDMYGDKNKKIQLLKLILNKTIKKSLNCNITINIAAENIDNENTIEETYSFITTKEIDINHSKDDKLNLSNSIIKAYTELLGFTLNTIADNTNYCNIELKMKQKRILETNIENLSEKINQINNNRKEIVYDYSNKTILITDDNKININIAKKLFAKYSFNIETATNGQECINLAKQKKYDIIFLDEMMPGLSGTQTLEILKRDIENMCPIVALTANSYTGLEEEYKKQGFTDYLSKPIEKDRLEKIITTILGIQEKRGDN